MDWSRYSSPEDTRKRGKPGCAVVELKVKEAREKKLNPVHRPIEYNFAHSELIPCMSRSIYKKRISKDLAHLVRIVIPVELS